MYEPVSYAVDCPMQHALCGCRGLRVRYDSSPNDRDGH